VCRGAPLATQPQGAETYLLPKLSAAQKERWPELVLEPMFWLLYATHSMITMGECVCVLDKGN
jgi:hypothetical protein